MNSGNTNTTPHSSSGLSEKFPKSRKGSDIVVKSSSQINGTQDIKNNLIAKNASLISDIVNSERGKISESFSPDKHKKLIFINHQNIPNSTPVSKQVSLNKLQSPSRTFELHQTPVGLKQNLNSPANSVTQDPRFPIILEGIIKSPDLMQSKKTQSHGYLFKNDEESPNQTTVFEGPSSFLQQKLSVPSLSQFNNTFLKQKKQNSPNHSQIKLSQSQYMNLTANAHAHTLNSFNNSQLNLGHAPAATQNTIHSFNDLTGQLNNQQQTSKAITQNNLYQLDKLMRNQMRENYSSLDNTYVKTPQSQSQREILKSMYKFTKLQPKDLTLNKSSTKPSTISARDISYMNDQKQSFSKQTETRINLKTEQNINILLSPSTSNKKKFILNSRKSSFSDLRPSVSNNQILKNSFNQTGFASSYLNSPTSTMKKISLQPFQTQNDFDSYSNEQLYNVIPMFPNNFIEEFLQTLKDINITGESSQISSSKFLTPINFTKKSSNSNTQILKQVHQEIQNILTNQTIQPMEVLIPSSLSELAASLKRQHPNLYTGQPSGRAEVQIVKNWLEDTFEMLQIDKEMHIKEKFQRIDDALTLTFNEMVRQVSYQCKERGMLLITVFSCYFSLVKKVSQYEQEEKRKINIQNYYDQLVLQKNADDDFENLNNQIKSLNELLVLEKQKNEKIKEELKMQEERERNTLNRLEKVKKLNDVAKVHIIKMKREMNDLRSRLQSKEMFQQKKLEKFLLEYKSNLKRSASTTYYSGRIQEKIEESDQQLIQNLLDIPKSNIDKKGTIDEINENLDLSFTDLVKDADNDARNFQNDVIIKQVFEDKSDALVCQECQTDPMMTLTYTKSIKCQTDLDLMDKKYEKVFASKQKIDEFIREQQIKQDLFALEDMDENDTSIIDQESGPPTSMRNIDKPSLSNLFQGLPIKKLKKKLPKNQLERFIENMGVLYSYIKEPETNLEKDRNENLKNMIQQNIRKEELQELISMREIKEVDEGQEGTTNKKNVILQQNINNITVLPHTSALGNSVKPTEGLRI